MVTCGGGTKRTDSEWVELARQHDITAIQWALDQTKRSRALEARKWFRGEADICDAEQQGVLGVFDAIEKFDTKLSSSFAVYAGWRIKRRIQGYFHNTVFPVRLPSWLHEKRIKFLRHAQSTADLYDLMVKNNVQPDIARVAAFVTSSPSMDGLTEHEENPHMFVVIKDREVPVSAPSDVSESDREINLLNELLDSLPRQQATLLRQLWRIEPHGKDIADVLREMNLSVEEGNEIQRNAIIRLRRHPKLKQFARRLKFKAVDELPDFVLIPKTQTKRRSTF